MTNAPSFDIYQRIYALSEMPNQISSASGTGDDLSAALFVMLSSAMRVHGTPPSGSPKTPEPDITAKIGDGELVWGPAVLPGLDRHSKNSAMVVRIPNPAGADIGGAAQSTELKPSDAYVLAIAGTDPDSLSDWFIQDAAVNKVVAWSDFVKNPQTAAQTGASTITPAQNDQAPYIAEGTAIGAANILGMRSPKWSGNGTGGLTLIEFFGTLSSTSPQMLVVAGHSLGGALAPTVAQYLSDAQPGVMSRFHGGAFTYPTAGPTPGNRLFSEKYAASFKPQSIGRSGPDVEPGRQYRNLNARLWNHFDVVPHAWASTGHPDIDGNTSPALDQVPTLYGGLSWKHLKADAVIEALKKIVAKLEGRATESGATYYTLPGIRLSGVRPSEPPEGFKTLIELIVQEHTVAYSGFIDAEGKTVPGLILPSPINLPKPADG